MREPVVHASNVRFRFNSESGADSFDFASPEIEIFPGEHTACTGVSGCGKTTLLRLLTGILTPYAGEISLVGQPLHAMADQERRLTRLRHVGMVFQEFKLLAHLTTLENAMLPSRLIGDGAEQRRQAQSRAKSLAQSLGISHTLRRKPNQLSQGERQRVAICRALVNRPSLLIGDEPTGNLDPDRARSTIELMRQEAEAHGATLLVVTHDHSLLDLFENVIRLPAPQREAAR